MSASRDIIDALVAAGMDHAAAATLLARAAVEMTAVVIGQKSKSSAALRQQRYRDKRNKPSPNVTSENRGEASQIVTNRNGDVTSEIVTDRNETITNRNESVTSFSERPTEEEKNRSIQGKERKKERGSRLLSCAREAITAEMRSVAIENGCPPDRVDALWSEFVDYWSEIPGRFGCKLSWVGTWRNRVKQVFGKGFNGNGKVQTGRNGGGSIIAALDRALEQSQNADLAAAANPVLSLPGGSIRRS